LLQNNPLDPSPESRASGARRQSLFSRAANCSPPKAPATWTAAPAVGSGAGVYVSADTHVLEITPPTAGRAWNLTIVYAFGSGQGGPSAPVVLGVAGEIYGAGDPGYTPIVEFNLCGEGRGQASVSWLSVCARDIVPEELLKEMAGTTGLEPEQGHAGRLRHVLSGCVFSARPDPLSMW
jgi:hypothetical protein